MTRPPRLDEALEEAMEGEAADPAIQHGETHTRRPVRTEATRSQGPKTRAANKERVKGSRLFNPR